MIGLARTGRFIVKPLVLSLGVIVVTVALLISAWTLWILVLRPAPDGFAPTSGAAAGATGLPPGEVQYTVDARSREKWVYFSFQSGTGITTSQDALDWDIAFRRTKLLTNGGDTNPRSKVEAVDLGKVALDEAAVPEGGFRQDVTHEDRGLENPALHSWYNYNWTTHVITSKNHTYALRTGTGEIVLITFVSYYCDDGSPGCVTFRFMRPQEPGPETAEGRLPLADQPGDGVGSARGLGNSPLADQLEALELDYEG